ncbi:phosphoribosyltransferase [Streptomyces sp. AC563]|uniref:phosphoribosyltransferase n=1 Tax=Streptomyces buecherae TaxID=2763006 RepID=UPI00164D4EF6|nr:phosphoribosyltransferase family protein [Streptomyces buecherae]MBC3988590.1 phosphoribosyltransferase [Streptomyces buecherae]
MRFADRRAAGRALAERLPHYRAGGQHPDPLVLALPRGGLPVADEVARALAAPLDIIVVRKIGAPFAAEVGLGAVVGDDPPQYDEAALAQLGLTEDDLAPIAHREREELRRRTAAYRQGRPEPELAGHTAIVVDDGLATGSTARAALLRPEADEVVCLEQPPAFHAVGAWYADFAQLTDAEVLRVLRADRP